MRRAARIDPNQPSIVKALRAIGCSVAHTHTVGKGFPDIVAAFRNRTVLLEIKDPMKPPSARYLTPDEHKFHQGWRGAIAVVETPEQAIAVMLGAAA